MGIEVVSGPVDASVGSLAFYGRCSTEDNQDPETSRGWRQANAAKFVEPAGGTIVADYFDVGQSRSVPWDRRGEASRLLAALKDPHRGWAGVVVGEGTRCWFGNQFSLIAPRFAAYGVDLWVPELGGKYDARRARRRGGRSRTATGRRTAGRAARCGRSSTTRGTRVTPCSVGGRGGRCC
jgi:hypothetical protein